jgi:hypothetical protein
MRCPPAVRLNRDRAATKEIDVLPQQAVMHGMLTPRLA